MEELATQILSSVGACGDPDNVSSFESGFYCGPRRARDVVVPSSRRHASRQINAFLETELVQRRFQTRVWRNAGCVSSDGAAAGAKSVLQQWTMLDATMLTRAAVEAMGKERRPAADTWSRRRQHDVFGGRNAGYLRRRWGGLGVALPCASAKRSRLLPDFFDDCSYVGRRLSPRD